MKWREKILHWGFELGIWFKGVDGVLELIGGILLLATHPEAINHLIVNLTQHELQNDPDDWFCNALRRAGDHLSGGTRLWGSLYLLSHGAIKIFLATGIILNQLWAYPTAMIVIGGFILFQAARLGFHFSVPLVAATVVDTIIVLLIWHEYGRAKRRPAR